MADPKLAPLLHTSDKIDFVDSHRPTVGFGSLKVTLDHQLKDHGFQATRTLDMAVLGPRFGLNPQEIKSCFPPSGSVGNFTNVLPHVLLSRASMPWERTADANDIQTGHDDGAPWCALLVFTEAELAGKASVTTISELLNPNPGTPSRKKGFELLDKDLGDDPSAPVTVLELSVSMAKKVLPAYDDLSALCTVRDVIPDPAIATDRKMPAPHAVVLANRVPESVADKSVRHVAHLVSLEHQYHSTSNGIEHWSASVSSGKVRLVSLSSWSFTCHQPKDDLEHLLQSLQTRWPAVPVPTSGLKHSAHMVEGGAVAVRHKLHDGSTTAAWYRGPLVHSSPTSEHVLVRRASDLLYIDILSGMRNISYAAAWELGRMLALKDPAVGIKLHQWKRRQAHIRRTNAHAQDNPAAQIKPQHEYEFPLTQWFEESLGLLQKVPFNYLLPTPDFLPRETLMPFVLHSYWIASLMDGAFSIGRTSAAAAEADVDLQYVLPQPRALHGVVLRSKLVSGWPDLIVEGHDTISNTKADILRFDRLDPETLLVIFDLAPHVTSINRIDIHPHPQAMHFGFPEGIPDDQLRAGGLGVVDMAKRQAASNTTGAGAFHMSMLTGVPRLSCVTGVSS